jgi:hypothetical protein
MRFYAGAPLLLDDCYAIGTVFVVDYEPRTLLPEQRRALRSLARHATAELDLRGYARRASARRSSPATAPARGGSAAQPEPRAAHPADVHCYLEVLLDTDWAALDATTRRFLTRHTATPNGSATSSTTCCSPHGSLRTSHRDLRRAFVGRIFTAVEPVAWIAGTSRNLSTR